MHHLNGGQSGWNMPAATAMKTLLAHRLAGGVILFCQAFNDSPLLTGALVNLAMSFVPAPHFVSASLLLTTGLCRVSSMTCSRHRRAVDGVQFRALVAAFHAERLMAMRRYARWPASHAWPADQSFPHETIRALGDPQTAEDTHCHPVALKSMANWLIWTASPL